MGYRSDVRLVTSKRGFEHLNNYVSKHLLNLNKEDDNLLKSCDVKTIGSERVYFGWDQIKWYENYLGDFDDVDAIEKGLDSLKENDYSYSFARIGENYDDYEEFSHDGEKEGCLPFPWINRGFDDNYMEENLGKIESIQEDHDEITY